MTKTYQLTIENKPFAYVFDEDGVVSYTPVKEGNGLNTFFKNIFSMRSVMLSQIGARMDYATVGFQSMRLLYAIATIHGSDNLFEYLKRMRDEGKQIGIGLKVKDGLLDKYYNDPHRVKETEALRNLREMSRY